MTYVPTNWIAGSTKLGPTNLNHLELGVQAAAATADAANTLAAAALPTPAGSNGQFLKRVGGVWVPTTFLASDVPGYPSDVTKSLKGDGTWAQITNADVASAAAIALSKLSGAYTAYTPTWSGPTPPALGNGTLTGKYIQIGKFTQVQIRLVMGSTSTLGIGAYTFSLPATSVAVTFFACGGGYLYDSSADSLWSTVALQASTTTVKTDITGAAGGYAVGGAAAPFSWAVGDEINLHFAYEAA